MYNRTLQKLICFHIFKVRSGKGCRLRSGKIIWPLYLTCNTSKKRHKKMFHTDLALISISYSLTDVFVFSFLSILYLCFFYLLQPNWCLYVPLSLYFSSAHFVHRFSLSPKFHPLKQPNFLVCLNDLRPMYAPYPTVWSLLAYWMLAIL